MKKLLLILAIGSLFSCEQIEEATPKKKSFSEKATIHIKYPGNYALRVAYLKKDEWQSDSIFYENLYLKGDTSITVNIDREQNFIYVIYKGGVGVEHDYPLVPFYLSLEFQGKTQIAPESGADHNSWQVMDFYEFYKQVKPY